MIDIFLIGELHTHLMSLEPHDVTLNFIFKREGGAHLCFSGI